MLSFSVKSRRLAIIPYTIIISSTSRSLRLLRLVTVLTLEYRSYIRVTSSPLVLSRVRNVVISVPNNPCIPLSHNPLPLPFRCYEFVCMLALKLRSALPLSLCNKVY